MTAPVQLPHVSTGNLLTDVSTAGAALAKGLSDELAKRREDAMKEALLRVKLIAAQHAGVGEPIRATELTPQGLRNVLIDRGTGKSRPVTTVEGGESRAPESQILLPTLDESGNPQYATIPRYRPGQPAQSVNMPAGETARPPAPFITTTETPQGPQVVRVPKYGGEAQTVRAGGTALQPRAQQFEVEKAQFANNMARAAAGMDQVTQTTPQAVDEAIQRMNIQGVLQSLPVVGAPLGDIAQRAIALGLSPEAANWLANFYTFVGFAVPEMAGKQMTITEMRQQTAMFAPLIGEAESARRIKRENIQFRVESAQRAAGSGMTRAGGAIPPTVPVSKPSKYGYNKPQ